ncbi:hypothetical protein RUM44_000657 [Polyplax serrata]|uniref:Uncharacterized protein n=1 Tax=Polyplax serrata TaxID=468196 RepID=A0ABR1B889_POLSC
MEIIDRQEAIRDCTFYPSEPRTGQVERTQSKWKKRKIRVKGSQLTGEKGCEGLGGSISGKTIEGDPTERDRVKARKFGDFREKERESIEKVETGRSGESCQGKRAVEGNQPKTKAHERFARWMFAWIERVDFGKACTMWPQTRSYSTSSHENLVIKLTFTILINPRLKISQGSPTGQGKTVFNFLSLGTLGMSSDERKRVVQGNSLNSANYWKRKEREIRHVTPNNNSEGAT